MYFHRMIDFDELLQGLGKGDRRCIARAITIVENESKGYEEISREKIIDQTNNAFGREVVWCAPAFANGCIYVRNDEKLVCVPLTN